MRMSAPPPRPARQKPARPACAVPKLPSPCHRGVPRRARKQPLATQVAQALLLAAPRLISALGAASRLYAVDTPPRHVLMPIFAPPRRLPTLLSAFCPP